MMKDMRQSATMAALAVFFIAGPVLAQPEITDVEGDMAHGGLAVITGSGFGDKDPAAPLMWDDFESGTDGQDLAGGWFTDNRGGPNPQYASDRVKPGSTLSVKQDYTFPGQYNNIVGLVNLEGDRYYISFYRTSEVSGGPSRNYKPLAIRGGPPGNWDLPGVRHDMYPTTESGHIYTEDCEGYGEGGNEWGGAWDYPLETWNRYEYYIAHGDPMTANGTYYYWRDLELRSAIENTIFRSVDCDWSNIYLSGYFARDENEAATYIWHDDVYIDRTLARVELGDGPTWSSCTRREIQIPSAWSDGSINVTVNLGSFSCGQDAYLYVVDAAGEVNENGFSVTLCGGETPDDALEPADAVPETPPDAAPDAAADANPPDAQADGGTGDDDAGGCGCSLTR